MGSMATSWSFTQVAVFREDCRSELRFDDDQGQDQATAP
jgi:hypothetical protein